MKYAKLLSLGLIGLALLGCNQTAVVSQDDTVEAATPQEENTAPQTVAGKIETPTASQTQNSPDKNIVQTKQTKSGKQIGTGFDCDRDGQADDARMDYDGDGIPDDCLVSDAKTEPLIDKTSFLTVSKSLESITKGCTKTEKTEGVRYYSICKKDGKVVEAKEFHSEAGAGLSFWFSEGKVVAVQRPHSEETFIFDNNGKLSLMFVRNLKTNSTQKVRNISNQIRSDAENLYNTYDRIFEAFNNNSAGKAVEKTEAITKSSSQYVPIDETSFQTISKSLEAITKGCKKSEKSKNGNNYEICKKGDRVVNASEYAPEAGAGLAYWFSPDGRVVAARYLASGDLYIFDSNGKVSSKIDVYESKKLNNISAEEGKQAEENLYGGYKEILKVFNL